MPCHSGEYTMIRRIAFVIGIAFLLMASRGFGQGIVYKAPSKGYAEEFCATYVPQGSTLYTRCLNGLSEGITGDMLAALVSSEGMRFIPDAYPDLVKVAPASEPEGSYTFTTSFYSEYLGSDGGIYHDRPVVQPELAISLPHGFYLNPWASRSNGDIQGSFGNEFDWIAGKAGKHYDIGVAYFAIVNIVPSDMVEFYANFTLSPMQRGDHVFTPYVGVEHYIAVHGSEPAAGTITRAGIGYDHAGTVWSLSGKIGLFYDTGAFGYAEGTLAQGEWGIMRQLSHGFSIGPQLKCAAPIALSFEDGRTKKCVVGLITSKSF